MSGPRVAVFGFLQALGTVFYVVFVVILLLLLPDDGDNLENKKIFAYLIPISLLLLFIVSAVITGSMVFGYSVVLLVKNRLRDAVYVVGATLLWIILFLFVFVGVGGVLILL